MDQCALGENTILRTLTTYMTEQNGDVLYPNLLFGATKSSVARTVTYRMVNASVGLVSHVVALKTDRLKASHNQQI